MWLSLKMGAMDTLRWGLFWTEATLVLGLTGEGFFVPRKRRSRKEEAVLGFGPSGTTVDGFEDGMLARSEESRLDRGGHERI